MSSLPSIKLDRGLHALHLFYRLDRERWARLAAGESENTRAQLQALCAANANPSHPRLTTYVNVGGKADLAFFGLAAELQIKLPGMDKAAAQALVDKAHEVCPYSNATRNNIPVELSVV